MQLLAQEQQLFKQACSIIYEILQQQRQRQHANKGNNMTKLQISNEQRLILYALYKQATVGACNTPIPSLLDIKRRAQWYSWNELGNMQREDVRIITIQ